MKTILLLTPSSEKHTTLTKPRLKRVITETARWKSFDTTMSNATLLGEKEGKDLELIRQQIRNKIAGYKSQDLSKLIYEEDLFVTFDDVWALLERSHLDCYYCKRRVLLLYEYVREPQQWTLERIDNVRGHTRDNVELACLHCNLRRRTMKMERYQQTKEMMIVRKLD
jgi:hypothetical protein